MNDEEFFSYMSECESWLKESQEGLKLEFGIGNHDKYEFDQISEILKFYSGNSLKVSFAFIPIGTFDEENDVFQWAWSNKNITESLKIKSMKLMELDKITGSEIFSQRKFDCDDVMAWQIAAICARHLNFNGVYVPAKDGIHRFIAIKRLNG